MFRHSQLETVKASLAHPAHAAMPLHARIQRAIRQLILDGALGPGKPLPASRALAKSLGVSRDTIESAYAQLHAEGFIERRVGAFTKSLFPGLRIGYFVLPPQLVKPMTVARTLLDGHTASIAQLTLARFMEDGHFGAHVRAMRGVYSARLGVLAELVRTHLSAFVEPRVPIGGLQMPCVLICDLSERAAIDAARRVGVDLLGLSALHADGDGKPGFLMGFAAYTPDELDVAVRKLAKALRTAAG